MIGSPARIALTYECLVSADLNRRASPIEGERADLDAASPAIFDAVNHVERIDPNDL
jgi:hypothetical protein